MWSPSHVVNALDCDLKAVLASMSANSLPAHPRAALGSVVHKLVENAIKGRVVSLDLDKAIADEFDRLLQQEEQRLKAEAQTAHFVPLSQVFSQVNWHNFRQTHLTAAVAVARQWQPIGSQQRSASGNHQLFERIRRSGTYAEIPVKVESLALSGRVDAVEFLTSSEVHIRDYKSGRVTRRDGTVLPSIALQLRLYGIAALELRPELTVTLSVNSKSRDIPVSFGEPEIDETKEWLESFISRTRGSNLNASRIATVGDGCANCSRRHVCPAYLNQAPECLWRNGANSKPPANDTWGIVSHFETQSDVCRVDIETPAEMLTRVSRLDGVRHQLEESVVGKYIWLFGLSSTLGRKTKGGYAYPRNFFEMPATSAQQRAWSLSVLHNAPT